MNRLRPIFLAVAVVVSALLAYGFLTLPKAQPSDAEGFSAARVLEDIEVISRKHHSVAHPEERAEVRDYLIQDIFILCLRILYCRMVQLMTDMELV